jgi:hypothetical protein
MFILHAQNEPNINATNVYETGQIALGDNVKYLLFQFQWTSWIKREI